MQATGGLSGRRLAGYELGAFLGEDGFGPRYEAHHLNLARTFTMRVLSDQFTFAQGFEESFGRMAQVLSKLEHANLLTLDDYGVDGPFAYLVTPFVEGLTLEAWLHQREGQPTNPPQVIRLFGQMLAGLGHAHQANVTHLGLSPKHFLVQPNGHLLIANFGLPYLAEQLWITWNGSRSFGDQQYLAPEQMPSRTPFGVAADLYTLGIILYRLLTGALPFEGTPQALLQAKLVGPPPVRARNPNLPAELEVVVQRALAPSPVDRWPSVAEFGGAFFHALGQANPLPSSALAAGAAATSAPLLLASGEDDPSDNAGPIKNLTPTQSPLGRRGVRRVGRVRASGGGSSAQPVASAGEDARVISWSSAGKGRISVPAAPPGWNTPPGSRADDFPPVRSRARRIVSRLLTLLVLVVTLAVLGVAIFYGYGRWVQIQHQMATPTVLPSPSPTTTPAKKSFSGGHVILACVDSPAIH